MPWRPYVRTGVTVPAAPSAKALQGKSDILVVGVPTSCSAEHVLIERAAKFCSHNLAYHAREDDVKSESPAQIGPGLKPYGSGDTYALGLRSPQIGVPII